MSRGFNEGTSISGALARGYKSSGGRSYKQSRAVPRRLRARLSLARSTPSSPPHNKLPFIKFIMMMKPSSHCTNIILRGEGGRGLNLSSHIDLYLGSGLYALILYGLNF